MNKNIRKIISSRYTKVSINKFSHNIRIILIIFSVFIAALSLSLFFSTVDQFEYNPLFPDDQGLFQRIALNLKDDFSFSGSVGDEKPFCPVRPPLYPVLLALFMEMSGEKWLFVTRLFQIFAHLVTILLIGKIAHDLYGNRTLSFASALICALICALIPHTAALTHVLLTESLTILLLVISIYFLIRIKTTGRTIQYLLLSVSLGMLILIRPTFLFLPIFMLPYLFIGKNSLRIITVSLFLMYSLIFLILLPWSFVNYQAGNKFTPTRLAGIGFNLMAGIVKSAPSLHRELEEIAENMRTENTYHNEMTVSSIKENISKLRYIEDNGFSEDAKKYIAASFLLYADAWKVNPPPAETVIAADAFLKKASLMWIKTNLSAYLMVIGNNLRNMLFGEYQPLVYQQVTEKLYLFVDSMRFMLYIFFVFGVFAAFLRRRFRSCLPSLLIIIYLIFIHMPMHTEPRYFVEAYPFMALVVPHIFLLFTTAVQNNSVKTGGSISGSK